MTENPRRIAVRPEHAERLFLTADLHFGHGNVSSLCGRPFADVEEMRETLIENWNAAVPENGITIVLGDMFWKRSQMPEHAAVMKRLNGEKHFVIGNHDKLSPDEYGALGFRTLSRIVELKVGEIRAICSHCPFLEWDGYWRGVWHFHGHTHGKLAHPSVRAVDVGMDAWNYRPVSFTALARKIAPLAEREMREMAERHG